MHEKNNSIVHCRRGPKHPLPHDTTYNERLEVHESPYYTIDNTEGIYGTNLLPSQRCYVDPWDLENYDYVRRKIDLTTPPRDYYSDISSVNSRSSPMENISNKTYYNLPDEVTSSTQQNSNTPSPLALTQHSFTPSSYQDEYYKGGHGAWTQANNYDCVYQPDCNNDDDNEIIDNYTHDRNHYNQEYLMTMGPKFQYNICNGYNESPNLTINSIISNGTLQDFSYNMTKGHSSLQRYEALKRQTIKMKPTAPPHLEFPTSPSQPPPPPPPPLLPLPLPPAPVLASAQAPAPAPQLLPATNYDYCHPYVPLPYWTASDCYECLSQIYRTQSLYATMPSSAGCCNQMECSLSSSSTLRHRRSTSSHYSTIYGNKFGMSNKGLLQIDYSCSWHDLNRAMCRNY